MLRLGSDRKVFASRVRRRIRLAGAHAARPGHSRRLRSAQERDRETLCPRAHGAARHGDDRRVSLLGRIVVIVFALWLATMAAGIVWSVGLLGAQWPAMSGDVGDRVVFWGAAFIASGVTASVVFVPMLIAVVLAEAFSLR